jgi:ABC-type multidrug transport system ATPase subunit
MIRVENLWKKFGHFDALRGLSFDVPDRSAFALIGANGAGKTTTIKVLMTGTTFTTGVPRLVTMTGSPVACTSFMTVKQRALKALARICFVVASSCLWSY